VTRAWMGGLYYGGSYGNRVWTGFTWPRLCAMTGPCERGSEHSGSMGGGGIS
jgi:hypothetical protein